MSFKLVSYDMAHDTWYCILNHNNCECLINEAYSRFTVSAVLNDLIDSNYTVQNEYKNPMSDDYTILAEVNNLEDFITDYPEYLL